MDELILRHKEVQKAIFDFAGIAVDLAQSLKDDIQEQRHVSDETIMLLAEFSRREQALEEILNSVNGIN